ncbi:MAG TPA: His-Xaa-Ser system radical SAM maturase HxsB [archaeon]|mgnify:CR=1 FL=1|nr:His-Xaa-Ser system radical SAM maturase HxsB [archaeon]
MNDPLYDVPSFRVKKVNDKFLVTNHLGGWTMLNTDDLKQLNSHSVHKNPRLFSQLIESGLAFTPETILGIGSRMKRKFWHIYNGTSLHVVAVTNRCNLKCTYCYASTENRSQMTPETAKKVADFVFQSPARIQVVEFSGGEPLLNFEAIRTIVERSEKLARQTGKTVGFSMIHNGTQWSDEKRDFFIRHKIGICFSLDGPKSLHNLHRKYISGGGTYDDVVKSIRKFRELDYPRLHALPVITKHSLPHWKDIVDEYIKLGFDSIRFKYLGFFGRAPEEWKRLGYTPEEFVNVWKQVVDYIYQLNKDGVKFDEGITRIIAGKFFSEQDPGYCELQMPCGAGLGQLAYSPDGGVYTCDEGRMFEEFQLGTVDQPLNQLLNSPVLKGMMVASCGLANLCDACALQPFCGSCPLEAYRQTGSLNIKMPLDRRCHIHGAMVEHLLQKMDEDPEFRALMTSWAAPRPASLKKQ